MGTETTKISKEETLYQPKTNLGRKLWQMRQKIIMSGEPLLQWEEIEKEVAERRKRSQ